jgi:hypothetical protein
MAQEGAVLMSEFDAGHVEVAVNRGRHTRLRRNVSRRLTAAPLPGLSALGPTPRVATADIAQVVAATAFLRRPR